MGSDQLHDTIIGDEWRWLILALAVVATVVMLTLWVQRRRDHNMGFAESLSLIGGALVCASVALASLGVILDWDSVWRLPFLAIALAYVVVGRGIQLWQTRRKEK